MSAERRRFPRVQVTWPVVMKTRRGSIAAKTRDIGAGGAFIETSERPDLDENFQVILKPSDGKAISVTAEKAWCGNISFNAKETYSGMGIKFIQLSPRDKQLISELVEKKSKE